MKSVNVISWMPVFFCLLISCSGKPSAKKSGNQAIAEEQVFYHTDRSFFFLKGMVKEMSLSYRYTEDQQSWDNPWQNAEGILVNFDVQGFITRLRWKEFDYMFANIQKTETFRVEGDPKLKDRHYYVVDSGVRKTYPYQHFIQIPLKQQYNGEIVGGEVAVYDAFFDDKRHLKKLDFNLFSSLIPALGGNCYSEKFEYRNDTEEFPNHVIQEVTLGGDGYSCVYEIKYIDMDTQGNWIKAKYYQDGELNLTVTRALTYY